MYCIANYKGELIAHDIETKEKAELKIHDIIAEIGAEEAEKQELEIIEQ